MHPKKCAHLRTHLTLEDKVKLANILEAVVKCLNEDLDQIEHPQLTFRVVDRKNEVQSGIVSVSTTMP